MTHVTAYIKHPAAGCFWHSAGEIKPPSKLTRCVQLLFMAAGEIPRPPFSPVAVFSTSTRHRSFCYSARRNRYYIRVKTEKKNLLSREDYRSEFWFWPEGFLEEKPLATLPKGKWSRLAGMEELTRHYRNVDTVEYGLYDLRNSNIALEVSVLLFQRIGCWWGIDVWLLH